VKHLRFCWLQMGLVVGWLVLTLGQLEKRKVKVQVVLVEAIGHAVMNVEALYKRELKREFG
jgi:hypothetical protein